MKPLKNPSKLGLGEKTSYVSSASNFPSMMSLLMLVFTRYPNSYIPQSVKINIVKIRRTRKYLRFPRALMIWFKS